MTASSKRPSGLELERPVGSFLAVTQGVLLRPANFFAKREEETLAGPIIYALICHALAVLLAGAYDFGRAAATGALDEISVVGTEGAAGAVLWLLWLLAFSPLYALALLFAGAGVYQLLVLLISGRSNAGYRATLGVTAYLSALSLVLWLPVLGLLAGPWGVWMMAAGLREAHLTSTARAVIVAAIPYMLVSIPWLVFSVASGQTSLVEVIFGGGTAFPGENTF